MTELERLKAAGQNGAVLTRGSSITPMPIDWLWHYWLAVGKLHILAGAPGAGKTTIALGLAATLTIAGRWPDGSRSNGGNVLIWSGEDDPADTLVPRLMGMGADMERIYFVTGSRVDDELVPFDPARDLLQLAVEAERIGNVKLLIVDPIVSAVAGDSHKNAEVRKGLQPLVDLAATHGAAVLGITHLSKGTAGRDPTERVTGSIAFSAVARIVMLAAKARGDNGATRRVLVRAKANIAPDEGGFEYCIDHVEVPPGISTSIVTWGQPVEGNARDLLAEADDELDGAAGAKVSAEQFLRELLQGPTPTKTVQSEAIAAGHSWATVRRASNSLAVQKRKGSLGWYWEMPKLRNTGNVLTQNREHVEQHEHVEQLDTGHLVQGAQVAHDFADEEGAQLDEVLLAS